jgi:hypothetical protein
MNSPDWMNYPVDTKLDVLRTELQGLKRLVQFGVGAAGFVGVVLGWFANSIFTHAVGWH